MVIYQPIKVQYSFNNLKNTEFQINSLQDMANSLSAEGLRKEVKDHAVFCVHYL